MSFNNGTDLNERTLNALVFFLENLEDYFPYRLIAILGCLFGIFGNILIMGAILTTKKLQTSSNAFVAIADFFVSSLIDSFTAVAKNTIYPAITQPNEYPTAPPPPYPPVYQQVPPVNMNNQYASQQQQQQQQAYPTFPVNNRNLQQQPVYQVPSNVVVIQQPQRWHPLSKSPISMNCPRCNALIVTKVTRQVGTATWLISGGVCLAGCVFPLLWLGCCFLPFCIDDCKDSIHHCPNCNSYIGTHTI